jgi:hypothetical protein
MSKKQTKIVAEDARYGVQLDYVLFPADVRELRRALAKNGYELTHVERLPAPPARLSFSGELARKAESTVILETDSSEIGVIARSLQDAANAFDDLVKVVSSELGISLNQKVRFYWMVVHYSISTGKAPRNEILKAENKEYIGRFSRILGEDLVSFSVRLAPKDAIPNQEAWFDIAIEPDILREDLYHVGFVFRDPNRDKTETFVKNLENIVFSLIDTIEA